MTLESTPLLPTSSTTTLPSYRLPRLLLISPLFILPLFFLPRTSPPILSPPNTFLALGDWGRKGKHNQTRVGQILGAVSHAHSASNPSNPVTVLSTGDNFYSKGVKSVDDKHFSSSFESVYVHPGLSGIPWYAVLGNHDHRGSVEAQVLYSKKVTRWNMPARYYTKYFSPRLLAIFMDTTPLVETLDNHTRTTDPQMIWLRDTLAKTPENVRFLIIAHHNMYTMSTSGHLGSAALRQWLLPEFKEYSDRIIAYVSGHEHALMHLQTDMGSGVVLDHLVSGAGSKLDKIDEPSEARAQEWEDCCGVLQRRNHMVQGTVGRTVWGQSVNGFFEMHVERDDFRLRAIDSDGNTIYEYSKRLV